MRVSASFDDVGQIAADKVGIAGWKSFDIERVAGGYVAKGCVPNGVYARGPRQGHPRFSQPIVGTKRTVAVSDADVELAAGRYELGGSCWRCKGSGEELASWSKVEGTRMRACGRCGGSGAAPAMEVVSHG